MRVLSGRLNRDRDAMIIDVAMSPHDMRCSEILCQFENYRAYFRLSKFISFVAQGEVVQICKHNVPVAKLIP